MPRMWMVDPHAMCRRHLVAEHHECHVFLGKLRKSHKLDGYINNNLLEVTALHERHEQVSVELVRRGFWHQTPFPSDVAVLEAAEYLPHDLYFKTIDRQAARRELVTRCPACSLGLGGADGA